MNGGIACWPKIRKSYRETNGSNHLMSRPVSSKDCKFSLLITFGKVLGNLSSFGDYLCDEPILIVVESMERNQVSAERK